MPQVGKEAQNLLKHWRDTVPNDRIAHLIRDVARAQMKALQHHLLAHGVSFGHWTFLRILWIHDGLTQKELSDLAGVMEPTTFTAVKAMESMGLIERKQLPGNRKNIHVFLTSAGKKLEKKTCASSRRGEPNEYRRNRRQGCRHHAAIASKNH